MPHGRWRTQTFLAAPHHDRITSPFLLHGPISGKAFLIYVECFLVPTLNPRDVVVMDNLKALLRKAGARTLNDISDRLRNILGVFSD